MADARITPPEVRAHTLDFVIERLVTLAASLCETHSRKQAYRIANQLMMDETGMDILATLPFGLDDLSDTPPEPGLRGLQKLYRYLSRPHSVPVPKFSPSRLAIVSLLSKGFVPRQVLMKAMHLSATDFNILIAKAKTAGTITEHDGAEFGYAGTLYKAGSAA